MVPVGRVGVGQICEECVCEECVCEDLSWFDSDGDYFLADHRGGGSIVRATS